uniref:SD21394p n=1 Tax=Drosophila melanogaster TaxID=7227 RepID=Q8MT12_DROME|nr:SD21394p [Drosophila melanogaster]
MDVCREIQKWVLNKGVGQSTMHKAARQGLIDVVVYCLDRMNMNPDQKDNAGYTPLHEACTQGWLEIARILLQYGANHSEAAQSGIRPLHGAIENDHEEVVRLLLSYGADPLLATYSGQTPLMLASSKLMRGILRAHLSDAQSAAADIKPMRFNGPWEIFDAKEYGYDIFSNVPNTACDMSRALRRERKEAKQQRMSSNSDRTSNLNGLLPGKKEEQKPEDLDQERVTTTIKQNGETSATKTGSATTTTATTMVKLEPGTDEDSNNNKNNEELNANVENNLVTSVVNVKNEVKKEVEAEAETEAETETNAKANTNSSTRLDEDQTDIETMDSELNGDIFEFEEADVPLPPLYLLKDEGSDKWVLLNDLCNLLKVKSKDTLLNKLCPNNSNALASSQKHLLREFKIDDFLEKATCLQLLCAGEKLNMFSSSKVVLIKYNDSVRNLLGVKTILMKF